MGFWDKIFGKKKNDEVKVEKKPEKVEKKTKRIKSKSFGKKYESNTVNSGNSSTKKSYSTKKKDSNVSSTKKKNTREILPLSDKKELLVKGTPVCDVCNRVIDVNKSYFVPNSIFYTSSEYKQWNKDHFPFPETNSQFEIRFLAMQMQDPTEGSAVCERCIHMFK